MTMRSETEEQYAQDAITFCRMVDAGDVAPIIFNDTTACMLHRPSGKTFTTNMWRSIVKENPPSPKESNHGIPKHYGAL